MYAATILIVASLLTLATPVSGQESPRFRVVSEETEQTTEMVRFTICFEGSPEGAIPSPDEAGIDLALSGDSVRLISKSITKGCAGEDSYQLTVWLEGSHFFGRRVYTLTIRNIVAGRFTYPIGRDGERGPWYTLESKPP